MIEINAGETVIVLLNPVDKFNNPTSIDGIITYVNSDPSNLINVELDADELSFELTSVGQVGEGSLSVTADTDRTAGVKLLTGHVRWKVVPGDAVSYGDGFVLDLAATATDTTTTEAPATDTTTTEAPATDTTTTEAPAAATTTTEAPAADTTTTSVEPQA